jgi:hypothetical protein
MATINGLDTKYDIKIIEKISSDALHFPSILSYVICYAYSYHTYKIKNTEIHIM